MYIALDLDESKCFNCDQINWTWTEARGIHFTHAREQKDIISNKYEEKSDRFQRSDQVKCETTRMKQPEQEWEMEKDVI